MSDRTARERAEQHLADAPDVAGYGHAQATAIAGVGWAVLDLADALRARGPEPVSFACQDEGPPESAVGRGPVRLDAGDHLLVRVLEVRQVDECEQGTP